MKLRIGIHTDGNPQLTSKNGFLTVENALIGVGFHWQRHYPLRIKADKTTVMEEPDSTGIRLVCEIGLEDYLRSVVSSEMNPGAPEEFIKAHAIIARSWALRQTLRRHNDSGNVPPSDADGLIRIFDGADHDRFDLCNDDHCQRFQGEDAVTARAGKAVADTAGLVLVDKQGEIADTRYSKCCGGRTELFSTCWQDRDHEYLQAVEDPWCDLSRLAEEERDSILRTVLKDYDRDSTPDFYRWHRMIRPTAIERNLRRVFGLSVGTVTGLNPVSAGPSGRISRLEIRGTEENAVIGKELAIRRILADDCLLSSAFTVENTEKGFLLHGKGWGHGVGLCQIGAAAMAHAGHKAEDILAKYYPGTRIANINRLFKL